MKRIIGYLLVIILLLTVWISPPTSLSDSERIVETKDWLITEKSDYPETVVRGSPDNEPLKLWSPEPFEGTGQLLLKWTIEIPYGFEDTFHNFNNTPEGWLYVTSNERFSIGNIEKIFFGDYSNRLIDPENGKVTLLEPKFSMFSHINTNIKLCDPPHIPNQRNRAKDFRCYNISKNKLRWHIRDTRHSNSYVGPFLPILQTNNKFFYLNSGITIFDSRTGEIFWSYDFKTKKNDTELPIQFLTMVNDYVWVSPSLTSDFLYRINMDNKNIEDCYFDKSNEGFHFLFDTKNLWIQDYQHEKINVFDTKTLELKNSFSMDDLLVELHTKSEFGEYHTLLYHKDLYKYKPITCYIESTSRYTSPYDNREWNGGKYLIRPYYNCDTFQFLLDRNNPDKLIEISPAKTGEKRTFMQVVDGELIIQTLDTITCFDHETLEEKWTIGKFRFENPKETWVYAVDWRGVLVRDVTHDDIAKFYCFDLPPKEPEPEPAPPKEEPIPEPTPEPDPIPEPLPVEEKVILKFTIDIKEYSLDDVKSPIDVAPLILNGRTFLPARFVTEPLGGDVTWDGHEKKVVCELTGKTVELWINKQNARVNGMVVQIDPDNQDVVPTIINDRTMVPMRFLAESLGCEVEWVAETKEIILTYTP